MFQLCEVLHGAPSVLKPVAELFARLQESQQVDIAITLVCISHPPLSFPLATAAVNNLTVPLQDTASQLKALSDSFQAFSNYLQKILSYMVLRYLLKNYICAILLPFTRPSLLMSTFSQSALHNSIRYNL